MCKCQIAEESAVLGGTTAQTQRELLPGNLIPRNYVVRIVPDLDTFTFTGTVAISVDVAQETDTVVLNAKALEVQKAWITSSAAPKSLRRQEAIDISYDTDKETVTFRFAESIPVGPFFLLSVELLSFIEIVSLKTLDLLSIFFLKTGASAVVNVEFTGIHNEQMAGFYKSSYIDDAGVKKFMVATQFESTDARQAFPSYDEPGLKATFECSLVVDEHLTALSNMNESDVTYFVNAAGKKVKEVKFSRTPLMSTYLIAFVVGELESIETVAVPKLPVGAAPITIRGLSVQGKFALDTAKRAHEFYSEYFNEAFPLPKSDLVAIPDFNAGAMENWGLVTYRTVLLLLDEEKATANIKKQIAYVIGHELGKKWNDLWLNEGFATFVGWLATNELFPEWHVWTSFVGGEMGHALSLDSLRSSHPIDVDVKNAKEVPEIFDAISYSKGATVIRMLNDFLGQEVFMNGVRSYLQEFKFKNTITSDLWKHLSLSSGTDVATLAHNWTKETGFPLVTVESQVYDDESKTLTVSVSQKRFLASGDLTAEEDNVIWWVPVTVLSHLETSRHVLSEKHGSFTFAYDASESGFWKLNSGASGMFRVKYQDEQIATIKKTLLSNSNAFTTEDKILFLSDALKLATAGYGSVSALLEIIDALANDSEYNIQSEIGSTLATLRSYSYKETDAIQEGIKALGRKVFGPKVVELGYDFGKNDDYFTNLKRGLAVSNSVQNGDVAVIAELTERFHKYVAGDDNALHPELRGAAFRTVLSNVTEETADAVFDAVYAIYKNPTIQQSERNSALGSLGSINSAKHVDRILNVLLFDDEEIKLQDIFTPLGSIASANPNAQVIRPLLIEYLFTNFDKFVERVKDGRSIGGVFSICVGASIGEDVIAAVEAWVAGEGIDEAAQAKRTKDLEGAKRAVVQALESVKTKTSFMNRERDALAAYFSL
ncbi:Aminopeptidase 2 mitochondrial [Physocladia obscura]|uniref:Aminopeptidase n=1 Tax=Physocladia obscura TaxID=109957 RepID=A0AAD5ST57_9FUNG|nr:Aminopeptidase 2 mitochondrial [Physocladia obscura]